MKHSKAITIAAQAAGSVATRFAAVETEARRIHAEAESKKVVRALMNGGGLHVLISDGKTTMEVFDGVAAVRVENGSPDIT